MYIFVKTQGASFPVNVSAETAATATIWDFVQSIAELLQIENLGEIILKHRGETIFNLNNEHVDMTRTLFSSLKLHEVAHVILLPTADVNSGVRRLAAQEGSRVSIEAGGVFDDLLVRPSLGLTLS